MNNSSFQTISNHKIQLLHFWVFCFFIGRAYEALFFDLPLRALFWDQNIMEQLVVTITNDSWQNYVTNQSINIDIIINNLGFSIGIIWLFTAITIWFIRQSKWLPKLYYFSSFLFFIITLLGWKDKFYTGGFLLEHATQIISPLLLLYLIKKPKNSLRLRLFIKLIIAITFVSHGLFAVAYYPVSGQWLTWTSNLLGFSSDYNNLLFLKVMGILDFTAAFLLFFKPTFSIAIWYCILWGFLTALVRIVANFYIEMPLESLHEWSYQCFFRLIHGGLPLFLWQLNRSIKNNIP